MKRFDWTILIGLFIGVAAVAGGAWVEGLSLRFLWHPTAALIVGGGTLGAVVVRRGLSGVFGAMRAVWNLRLKDHGSEEHPMELAKLAWLSRNVKKSGLKEFENYAEKCDDVMVAQGLSLLADNAQLEEVRVTLAQRLEQEDRDGLQDSSTLEAAGGFAPTFGILGAVIGLIGVLRILDHPDALGTGIATAFVATIYGIALANLLFFPLATRLKSRHEVQMRRREEIASVILALGAKEPPRSIMNKFNLRK
jgi:chemotaxis protein MotA